MKGFHNDYTDDVVEHVESWASTGQKVTGEMLKDELVKLSGGWPWRVLFQGEVGATDEKVKNLRKPKPPIPSRP